MQVGIYFGVSEWVGGCMRERGGERERQRDRETERQREGGSE